MLPTPLLRTVLSAMRKVITGKSSLAVLGTVHVQRTGDYTQLTVTNLDVALTYTERHELPPPNTLKFFMEQSRRRKQPDLNLCIPFSDLAAFAKAVDPRSTIEVRPTVVDGKPAPHEFTSWHLHGRGKDGTDWSRPTDALPGGDFPPSPRPQVSESPLPSHSVPSLSRRLGQVIPFISTDSTRYVLNGVHVTENGDVVATDGRRCGIALRDSFWSVDAGLKDNELGCEPEPFSCILPALAATVAHHIFPPEETIKIERLGAKYLRLEHGPWKLITREIEGSYPAYERVIPNYEYDQDYQALPLTATEAKSLGEMLIKMKPDTWGQIDHTTTIAKQPVWTFEQRDKNNAVLCQRGLHGCHENTDAVKASKVMTMIVGARPLQVRFNPIFLGSCILAAQGAVTLYLSDAHAAPIVTIGPNFTGVCMPFVPPK